MSDVPVYIGLSNKGWKRMTGDPKDLDPCKVYWVPKNKKTTAEKRVDALTKEYNARRLSWDEAELPDSLF